MNSIKQISIIKRIIIFAVSAMIVGSAGCSSGGGSNGLLGLMLTKKQVETPVFSLSAGTYSTNINVAITCSTPGALIYVTTNGDDPTSSSSSYINPIDISGDGTTVTVKAIAIMDNMSDSEIASAEYTIDYEKVSTPQFSPVEGTYNHDLNVTISCLTADVQIYYTTNGDDPTILSDLYSSSTPISISGDETVEVIKAIAVKTGMKDSTIGRAEYSIEYDHVSQPIFTPTAGTYDHDLEVEITCSVEGATIYYTTNGDLPTTSSSQYTGTKIPIEDHGTDMTIRAIAVKDGMAQSAESSGDFHIRYDTVSKPQFNYTAGTYNHDLAVMISCPTAGATIYFTTNNTPPDESSDVYTDGMEIPVEGHGTVTTIRAIAVKDGMLNSTEASATYTIQYSTVATPYINPYYGNPTTLFKTDYVSISCSTTGAKIYFTTNGDDPTSSSTEYTTAIPATDIAEGTTVRAIAVKTGMLDSAVLSRTFSKEDRNVYIGGYHIGSNNEASYWYNYSKTTLISASTSYVNRILETGGIMYAAGYHQTGANCYPHFWKASTRTDFAASYQMHGLFIDGATIYTCGLKRTTDIYGYLHTGASYWTGINRTDITTAYESAGYGMALLGTDVYVAGWNRASSSSVKKACYWINDTRYDLSVPLGSGESAATDMVISGTDVYIAGWYTNGTTCSCYWKNGVRTDLETTNNASATKIAVSGTDVYVAGNVSTACYWVNTTKVPLTGSQAVGISIVGSDVYVVENKEFYEGATLRHYWVLTKNGTPIRADYDMYRDDIATSLFVLD